MTQNAHRLTTKVRT